MSSACKRVEETGDHISHRFYRSDMASIGLQGTYSTYTTCESVQITFITQHSLLFFLTFHGKTANCTQLLANAILTMNRKRKTQRLIQSQPRLTRLGSYLSFPRSLFALDQHPIFF